MIKNNGKSWLSEVEKRTKLLHIRFYLRKNKEFV